MIYQLLFIFAFSCSAFAQKLPPESFYYIDEFCYDIVMSSLEYYLRHNVTGTKKCYMKVKDEYFDALQECGWGLKTIIDQRKLENFGKNNKEKEKINRALKILVHDIAGTLHNDYLKQLASKIQRVQFYEAAILLVKIREKVRNSLGEYKNILFDLKNAENYKDIEGTFRGLRLGMKLYTDTISQKLRECIKEEKCKSASS